MNEEIWKDVVGYGGLYTVSNYGRIMNKRGKFIRIFLNEQGYCCVHIWKNNKYSHKRVHRLVGEAFISNLSNLPVINHKDCNKQNNFVDNLEWCTASYNMAHAYKNNLLDGFIKCKFKKGHLMTVRKLSPEQVVEIKRLLKETDLSQYKIAKMFGVSRGTISAIVYGYAWRDEGVNAPIKKSRTPKFIIEGKWMVGDVYKTKHNHLMKVVGIRKDGVAFIEMVEPYKTRSHTQRFIPYDWEKI